MIDAGAPVVVLAPDASIGVSGANVVENETWQDAMREERWADALRILGAAKNDEAAITRFARARANVELGRPQEALNAADSLDTALPLLTSELSRIRARAKALAGSWEEAGDWFSAQVSSSDQLEAARIFDRAKFVSKAKLAANRVINAPKHTRAEEAESRAIRIRLGSSDDEEIADAKWLFVHAVDLSFGEKAKETLAAHHVIPKQDELAARARALADAGKSGEALATQDEIDLASRDSVADKKRARADLLMRARAHHGEAAKLYFDAFKNGKAKAADDLLASARALSRDNQDDAAIDRYDEVNLRNPRTPQAEQATFLAARLALLHGHWADASKRFDDYVKRFPQGADRSDGLRLQAISHFQKGDIKGARKLFEEAAGNERNENAATRLSVLAANAALQDGDKTHAVARYNEIASAHPLTWAALVARAHLAKLGETLPPAIGSAAGTASSAITVALPAPVDTLHSAGLDGDAERALRSREAAVIALAPSHADEALCRTYGMLDRAERRYQFSNTVPRASLAAAPSEASRWAWECVYPTPFSRLISRVEMNEKLPTGLVHSVMRQESAFDTDIVSPARAVGLMQLLPETGVAVGVAMNMTVTDADLVVPASNIKLGGRYLHDVLDRVHSVPLAIAAYNCGPDAISRWSHAMNSDASPMELDVFVETIPYAETRGYVVRVMGNLARYGYLAAGENGVPKIDLKLP